MTDENQTTDFNSLLDEIAGELDKSDQIVPEEFEETNQANTDKAEEPEVEQDDSSEIDDIAALLDGEDAEADDADEDPENSDEEAEESEEEQEEGETKLHTVKIDGEEHEVTLSELKKSFGLQQSLTRKGQEMAEMRKQLEAETEAVAWAKQQPEVREKAEQIKEAVEAVQRGFVFDRDGNQVQLTQKQIEDTQANIERAQSELAEMAKPPRYDELLEAFPVLKSNDPQKIQEEMKPYDDILVEYGYSSPERTSMSDSRIFLMLKELHELRDLQSQVNNARAKRKEKSAGVVSKSSKGSKGTPSKSKPTPKPKSVSLEEVHAGNANWADFIADAME